MTAAASTMLDASQIPWTPAPQARPEDDNPVDVFALSQAALLEYAFGLQDDLRALRGVLSESLQGVHDMTQQVCRQQTRIRTLVDELRDLRDHASALRGRLHDREEAA